MVEEARELGRGGGGARMLLAREGFGCPTAEWGDYHTLDKEAV